MESAENPHGCEILFIAINFPPVVGGSAVVYDNLCRRLDRRVAVLTAWRDYRSHLEIPGYREADATRNYQIHRVELLCPRTLPAPCCRIESVWRRAVIDWPLRRKVLSEALRLVDKTRPRVVCLGEVHHLSWLGAALRRMRGLRVIQYIHGEEITMPVSWGASRSLSRRALVASDGVIAVSSFTRDQLKLLGVPEERIHLIPNGVDSDRFTPGRKDPRILDRHQLHQRKVLLTLARVEEKKGHDTVIRALPAILAAHPQALYVIVGDGGYRNSLRQIARDTGVEGQVIFVGRASDEDLVPYYRTCDLFIMPNRDLPNGDTEGFGLVFLEAGACGKPVIAGRGGGVADAVIDGQTGILVNGESVEEVAAAAIKLLSKEKWAAELGQRGLERARGANWDQRAAQFLEVCHRARRRG